MLSARPVGRLPISYVDVDSVAGAGLAVEHLLERGRRRIATVAGPQDMPAGQDRLRGWQEALAAARAAHGPSWSCTGTSTGAAARGRWRSCSAGGDEFDGLFVASDLMALDALAVLREHGLRVPERRRGGRVRRLGRGHAGRPALTTVRQPVEEMAKALTLTLLDRIGDPDAPITSRVFPPKLIPRAST